MSTTSYRIVQKNLTVESEFFLNLPPMTYSQAHNIANSISRHMPATLIQWVAVPETYRLRSRKVTDTLSVVNTEFGTTLARYCLESKTWFRYSDGRYLKGTVSVFRRLFGASWQDITEFKGDTNSLHVVQTVTGRYVLATYTGLIWMCESNSKVLREDVAHFVKVSDLEVGTWKTV